MDDARPDGSDAEYRQMTFNAVPALISYFDADHVCRFANEHHLQWYGRSPSDLQGLHMREFLGEAAYVERLPFLQRVANGEPVSFEATVPHLADSWREAAIQYVPKMGINGFEGLHILVFDVARQQHRFHSVFDGTAMGFWEIDLSAVRTLLKSLEEDPAALRQRVVNDLSIVRRVLDATTVVDANEKVCSMIGAPRASVVGRSLGLWCPTQSLRAWNGNLLGYLDVDAGHEVETVIERADGSALDVLLSCAFPKKPDEQTVVVVGVVDISARIAKEQQLARVQADLAHATRVAMLGEMVASIAHEVNQPLAAIVANGNAALRWLRRAEPDLDEARLAIERVIGEGSRASEIIARTRRLAMKDQAEWTLFEPNEMVDESAAIVRRQIATLGATLDLSLAARLPEILADRIQLQQVMINLMINAAQAMAGAQSEVREVSVRTTADFDAVLLEVLDTGPGISDEGMDQIFNAFYSTKQTGMGMGLSIAKTIVEAHGGRISVRRRTSGGAAFSVRVPIRSLEQQPAALDSARCDASSAGGRP